MKKLILNKMSKIAVVLGLAALMGAADTARAASIKFEVRVPGYSGWTLVLPELRSQLGGRVRYDAARGCNVTDRVQRGEQIKTTISPTTAGERCQRGAIAGIVAANGTFYFQAVNLAYSQENAVSRDPSFDNAFAWVITNSGYFEKRVPIGTRPN